jgi:hypothetical protein
MVIHIEKRERKREWFEITEKEKLVLLVVEEIFEICNE